MLKTRSNRILVFLTALLMLAAAAAGCTPATEQPSAASSSSAGSSSLGQPSSSGTDDSSSKEEILIGFSASITGSVPLEGEYSLRGAELAVEEINAAGGVLGRKLKLVVEDDQNLANIAVNAVNKLVSDDIVALVGPHKSFAAKAVMQITQKAEIPYLSGATSPTLLTFNNPYFFRLRASDSLVAKVAAKFAVEELSAKKIGIFYANDEYGTGAKDVIESYLKSVNISYVSEGHNVGDKDMTGQIIKLKNEGVDAIISWTHGPECAVSARQFKELGLNAPVVSGPGYTLSDFLDLVDGSVVEGSYAVNDFAIDDPDPALQALVTKMKEKYNITPDFYALTYYDAIYTVADAITRAGGTDHEAIRKALMETKDLDLVMSTQTANDSGELVHEAAILQLDSNKQMHLITHVTE